MPSHQPSPLPLRAVAVVGAEAVARALRRRRLREAGGVRVAAQRVADQDDVVARRRERPVGLVGDADRMQLAPAVEPQRTRKVEVLRLDRARPSRRRSWALEVATPAMISPVTSAAGEPGVVESRVPTDLDHTRERGFTMAMATADNGVNVQALLDAREALKGAPEATKFTWRASCKWVNGTHSQANGQRLLRPRRGAVAQDRDDLRGRPSGDLRVGGQAASRRSSTCSSGWRAASRRASRPWRRTAASSCARSSRSSRARWTSRGSSAWTATCATATTTSR